MPAPSDETRQKLLDAAGEVFAAKGLKAANVREICQKAGANLAAVNYHFGGKEQLYLAAVRHAHQTCQQIVPAPVWGPDTPAEVKLRDFIRTFVNRVIIDHEPPWLGQLIVRELFQPSEACRHLAEEFARPNFNILQSILADLLPPEMPQKKRHMTAFSIIGQILHYRLARPIAMLVVGEEEFLSYDVETLTDHIYEFSQAALRSLSGPKPASRKGKAEGRS